MPVCGACNKSIPVDQSIGLWNNGLYCTTCVAAASPLLLEQSGRCVALEEEPPRRHLRFLKPWAKYTLVGVLLLGAPTAGLVALSGNVAFALPVFGMAIAVMPVLTAVYWLIMDCLMAFLWRSWVDCRIRVSQGTVEVRSPLRMVSRSLRDCTWSLNSRKHHWPQWGLGAPSVLISFPGRFGKSRVSGFTCGCGYTSESSQVWTAFLELAGVPTRRGPRELWREAGVVLGFALSFTGLGIAIGVCVAAIVGQLVHLPYLAQSLAASGAALGCIGGVNIAYAQSYWRGVRPPVIAFVVASWSALVATLPLLVSIHYGAEAVGSWTVPTALLTVCLATSTLIGVLVACLASRDAGSGPGGDSRAIGSIPTGQAITHITENGDEGEATCRSSLALTPSPNRPTPAGQ